MNTDKMKEHLQDNCTKGSRNPPEKCGAISFRKQGGMLGCTKAKETMSISTLTHLSTKT